MISDPIFNLYLMYVSLAQTVCYIWLFARFFKTKEDKKAGLVLLFIIMQINDMFWSYMSYLNLPKEYLLHIIWDIAVCMILWCIFRRYYKGNALLNTIFIFAMEFCYMLVMMLVTYPMYMVFVGFDPSKIEGFIDKPGLLPGFLVLFSNVLGTAFFYPVWKNIYRKKRKNKVFITFCILFAAMDLVIYAFVGWRAIIAATIIIAILLVLIFGIQSREEKEQKKQFAYYQALKETQESKVKEISEIRHDIANHMMVMQEMEKDEGGKQILKKLEKHNISFTGISVIDCLVAEKEQKCEEKKIMFRKEGENIKSLSLSEYDLVSLFANLLDNAIEAAEKTREPFISLKTETKQGYLQIVVVNSKPEEETPVAHTFQTTKKDKGNHGIGSKIIRRIVDDNDGRITYTDEGKQMKIKVILAL